MEKKKWKKRKPTTNIYKRKSGSTKSYAIFINSLIEMKELVNISKQLFYIGIKNQTDLPILDILIQTN